ncbi:hypothetical protein LIOPPNJA_26205 [Robbsia andropogonis]|uniref:hypothetical protein n=1 Tax=Robbsia andropogonis TaxID=28092 RepID=UPI00209F52A3|nr:hypothetical protein [Robbsia andropogonis]MCP1131256.1 hypothetical protein [Robbsia andropogonis]
MSLPDHAEEIPLLDGVTKKCGRGRPRKENALSNAERQKAFRARRAAAIKSVTVTKKIDCDSTGIQRLLATRYSTTNTATASRKRAA